MEFDKNVKRFSALFATLWLVFVLIGLAVTGFLIWVIIALLRHFGIV